MLAVPWSASLGGSVPSPSFNVHDLLHPQDLAARQRLESIPGLQAAAKRYRSMIADRRDRAWLLSTAIRLGPRQVPDVYKLLPPVCEAFGIDEPELYLTSGSANALTYGHSRTCIVIQNDLLLELPEDEVQAVLAHECAHIFAEHLLYRQMALALFNGVGGIGSLGGRAGVFAAVLSEPLQAALLDWFRKSELTADRAAVAFMGGPEELQRALFHLHGIPKWLPKDQISYAAFAAQADEFDDVMKEAKLDRFLLRQRDKQSTHPNPALRLREIQRWAESETLRQVLAIARDGGTAPADGDGARACRRCGRTAGADWMFCQGCGEKLLESPEAGS